LVALAAAFCGRISGVGRTRAAQSSSLGSVAPGGSVAKWAAGGAALEAVGAALEAVGAALEGMGATLDAVVVTGAEDAAVMGDSSTDDPLEHAATIKAAANPKRVRPPGIASMVGAIRGAAPAPARVARRGRVIAIGG
jgi:hypothetical protein